MKCGASTLALAAAASASVAMGAITIDNNQFQCTTGVSMSVGGSGGSGGGSSPAPAPPPPPPYEPDPREFCGEDWPRVAEWAAATDLQGVETAEDLFNAFYADGNTPEQICGLGAVLLISDFVESEPWAYKLYHHFCEQCEGVNALVCESSTYLFPFGGACYNLEDFSTDGSVPVQAAVPMCADMDANVDAALASVKPLATCETYEYACTRYNDAADCVAPAGQSAGAVVGGSPATVLKKIKQLKATVAKK